MRRSTTAPPSSTSTRTSDPTSSPAPLFRVTDHWGICVYIPPHQTCTVSENRGLTCLSVQFSGGEEVLLDVAGQDSTEAFEDVGHSDEAREILESIKVGTLKRLVCFALLRLSSFLRILGELFCWLFSLSQPGDPAPAAAPTTTTTSTSSSDSTGLGIGLYAVLLVGAALAYGVYQYMATQQAQQQA